jgi:hypothetical protein
MTREEALQILDTIQTISEQVDALEMAIQALSQEPCDDAISREAVMRLIENKPYDWSNLTERHNMLMEIRKLPSVTRQSGKWIDDEFGSKCSCCGIHTHLDKFDRPMKFKYCSMCGAKMESEDKE